MIPEEQIFKIYRTDEVKLLKRTVPAHWRYWTFLGFVVEEEKDWLRVQVYGRIEPGWIGIAAIRKALS